jgi:hypothetical protein
VCVEQVRAALHDVGHATALAAFQKADTAHVGSLPAAGCVAVLQQVRGGSSARNLKTRCVSSAQVETINSWVSGKDCSHVCTQSEAPWRC